MPLASRTRASALASLILSYAGSSAAASGTPMAAARGPLQSSGLYSGMERGLLARERRARDDMFDRLEL
jgi:hypothetical protein